MKLFLIRHAQSVNNALRAGDRAVVDPPLTPQGVRQAELLAQHLAHSRPPEPMIQSGNANPQGYSLTHLYCSAMLRSLQTAQPIGRALGLHPEVWIALHEEGGLCTDFGYGRGLVGVPGQTRAEILKEFPDFVLPAEITDQGWWRGVSEDRAACFSRAGEVAAELRRRQESTDHIGIVSHGNFIDALLKALLRQGLEARHYFLHYNTGITYLDFHDDGYITAWFRNRTAHLPVELVS